MANTLTLTKKTDFTGTTIIVRSKNGTVGLSGTYGGGGTPTDIEWSWQGSSFVAMGATVGGGTWSGALGTQNAGTGTLNVRWANDHTATDTTLLLVARVNLMIGDSTTVICSNQAPTGGAVCYAYYDAGDEWMNMTSGSWFHWPLLLSQMYKQEGNVPQAMVLHGVSGSHLLGVALGWQKTSPSYTDMLTTFTNSAVDRADRCVCQVTNNDTQPPGLGGTPTSAALATGLQSLQTNLNSDVAGAPVLYNWLFSTDGNGTPWGGITPQYRSDVDQCRQGTILARNNGYMRMGANLTGYSFPDLVHPSSQADAEAICYRYWAAISNAEFATNTATPKIVRVSSSDNLTFLVTFDQPFTTAINTTVAGFSVWDGSTQATITSCKVTASTKVTIVVSAWSPVNPTVSFASSQDALSVTLPVRTLSLPDTTLVSTVDVPPEAFFNVALSAEPTPNFGTVFASVVR